jgi:integrase
MPADPTEIAARCAAIETRLAKIEVERRRLRAELQALHPAAKEPTTTMKRRRLTDLAIKAIRPPANGRVQVPDSKVGGLWLRVTDTNVRSWSVLYRLPGRSTPQRVTLGKWPGLSCAAARQAAKAVLADVAAGRDPASEKREKRHQNDDLVEQVATEFVARVYRAKARRTTAEVEAMLRNHLLPHWSGRRIGSITKHDVLIALDRLADQGWPRATNKVHALVRHMMRWAKGRDLLTVDPTEGIDKPFTERSRDRVLDDRELAAVWQAADALGSPWREYVRLLVLLGQRRTETAALRWSCLDLRAKAWHMPAEDSKMQRARTLPLPAAVVEILEALPRIEGVDHVFGAKLTAFGVTKRRLDELSGVTGWTLHDLRRTFATGQQQLGTRLEVTEQLLGHRSGSRAGIIGIYQRHDFATEQRQALQKWSDHVARLTGGAPARVVSLR